MKEIKLQDNTYLFVFVEIPDDSQRKKLGTFCNDNDLKWQISYLGLHGEETKKPFLNFNANGGVVCNVELSNNKDDKFEIITTTKDITEEQAESIVYHHVVSGTKYYSNYLPYPSQDFRDVIDNSFKTAKESLQSLIQANRLDITKNYIILRKS